LRGAVTAHIAESGHERRGEEAVGGGCQPAEDRVGADARYARIRRECNYARSRRALITRRPRSPSGANGSLRSDVALWSGHAWVALVPFALGAEQHNEQYRVEHLVHWFALRARCRLATDGRQPRGRSYRATIAQSPPTRPRPERGRRKFGRAYSIPWAVRQPSGISAKCHRRERAAPELD